MELIQVLGQADRELGRLDMHSEYIPDNVDNAKSNEFLPGCNHIFGERRIR